MTKEEQQTNHDLCCKYNKLKKEKEKVNIRNQLYFNLKPYLIIWIKSILRKWKLSQTDEEILSHSWHCFINGLDKYNRIEIPLPFHFYTYTMYQLYSEFVIKNNKELNENKQEINVIIPDFNLLDLHSRLPESNQQILYDILTKQSLRKTKGNYYKHKKILKKELKALYE